MNHDADAFYFCVCPFLVFQSRLPLWDRALKLRYLYIAQTISNNPQFITPNHLMFWNTITYLTLITSHWDMGDPPYRIFSFLGRLIAAKYQTGPQTDVQFVVSGVELICFLSCELLLQHKISNSVLICASAAQASCCLQMRILLLCLYCDCVPYCIWVVIRISLTKHSALPVLSHNMESYSADHMQVSLMMPRNMTSTRTHSLFGSYKCSAPSLSLDSTEGSLQTVWHVGRETWLELPWHELEQGLGYMTREQLHDRRNIFVSL